MVHDTEHTEHAEHAPDSAGAWWERVLEPVLDAIDPALEFAENHVLDPVDAFVTPKVERYQAKSTHHRVSTARFTLQRRVVWSWPWRRTHRARLLSAWAGLETAASATRHELHEAAHVTDLIDDGADCCAELVRLYKDRAELLRSLAVVEEQSATLTGRSPNFGAMPSRIRRLASESLEDLACSQSRSERAESTERAISRLSPEFGAAVEPLRQLYV